MEKPVLKLTGVDGNAFMILGLALRALRASGYSQEKIEQFKAECYSGDYDNLLQTCMKWCEVI